MDEFERIKVIGKGSYGEVWLAKHKKDKKQYVLKRMNLQRASQRERKSAEQEAKLLSKLKHPNIVSYKDSFETPEGMLYIAMQYCEGGDLYTRLKEQKGVPLEERQVVEWFVQITMALQYMHERNILHRDLKTQNIFLTKSKIIKVGDLGIARVLESASDMATTLIGTPYYMSPELFSNKPYNHKSDVWALGCCVYEMTTLKHAFNAKDMNSLVYKILKGKMPQMPRQYSQDLLSLMRCMLHQDPDSRPSVNRILRDPYIKRNIAIFLEDTKKNNLRRPSSASNQNQASSSSLPVSSTATSVPANPASLESKSDSSIPALPRSAPIPKRTEGRPPSAPIRSLQQQKYSQKQEPISRDETDSTAGLKQQVFNGAGDAPVYRSHARKPSDAAPKELEPIQEVSLTKVSEDSLSSREDTVVPKTVKEVRVAKEESNPEDVKKKKKKKLIPANNHAAKQSGSSNAEKTEPDSKPNSLQSDINHASKNNKQSSARPLPLPKAELSQGLPQKREALVQQEKFDREGSAMTDSTSSKSSSLSDGNLEETPRSLPNLSARERRRQKNPNSNSLEQPHTARVKLRQPHTARVKLRQPERSDSQKITRKEKSDSAANSSAKPSKRQRQPLPQESSSSSDESKNSTGENTREREKRRENKEINHFINLLDTTLHMNSALNKSDDEPHLLQQHYENGQLEENPRKNSLQSAEAFKRDQDNAVAETVPVVHKSASMPSVETLSSTSRLMDRIRVLHKDCVQGVGYQLLKKASDIMNHIEEDEVEPKLMELLGKEKFDEYAGKIWQLKFCEECLFVSPP